MKSSKYAVITSRGGNALIQFLIVLFYASSLSASEFGQLSILMIVVGLAYGLTDFGTANTVITCRITKDTYGALQLLNFIIASSIGVLLALLSFLRPEAYRFDDSFFDALALTLPILIIYSFTIVPYARLHKSLKLTELSIVDFLPTFSMLLSVPVFLYLEFGLLSLPASLLIQVLLRYTTLRRFYGKMFAICLNEGLPIAVLTRQYSSNLVVYLTSKLDQIVVAAFLSTETLGTYSFLKQVLNYPISILIAIYTQIAFPYFSRYRSNKLKVCKTFFAAISILLCVLIAYFLLLVLIPEGAISNTIPLWGFSNEMAILLMILSVSRLLLESASAMAIAVGFVGRQLLINTIYLLTTLFFGLALPSAGLKVYLIGISISATLIFCYVLVSTLKKLRNG